MQGTQQFTRFTASLLSAVLLLSSFGLAQEAAPEVTTGAAQRTAAPAQSQQQTPPSGVSVDPSAGPLQPSTPSPAETQTPQAPLPNAPQPSATTAPPAQQPPYSRPSAQEPLGTAAAEQVRTAGGAASRPAGNAVAPVKQRQYRSLIIKLGAVAAAGIAVGAVYGLSHATSSTPPHSTTATASR